MAKQSVAKPSLELVRHDMSYSNNSLRGLSIFLGCKSVEEHVRGLSKEERQGISSFYSSQRDSAITHLVSLGKLLSGFDESTDEVSAFKIGWLVQNLAEDAEAGIDLADMCAAADICDDERAEGARA